MPLRLPWHDPAGRKAHWETYERRRVKWEGAFAPAVARVFRLQGKRTLRAVATLFAHQGQPTLDQVAHVLKQHLASAGAKRAIFSTSAHLITRIWKVEGTHAYTVAKGMRGFIARLRQDGTGDDSDGSDSADTGYSWSEGALRHLSMRENKLNGVADSRYEQIKDSIARTMFDPSYDGGSQTVADALREEFGFDGTRALLIARTETTSAAGGAALDGFREGGAPFKGWLAVQDDRTRESHQEVDGEVVDIDEAFSNGLDYPGDPKGDAEEVCNCRCTVVPEFEQ